MPGEIKFSKSTLNLTRVTENFNKLGQGNLWDNAKVSRTTLIIFSGWTLLKNYKGKNLLLALQIISLT